MDTEFPSTISSSELSSLSENDGVSTTEESFEIDDWSSLSPTVDPNYYQQQQQYQNSWSYQNYQYSQYGYLPSPYNSYYMPSPPIEYHQQNSYGSNSSYDYQMANSYEIQPQLSQSKLLPAATHSCDICVRTFKSSSNLTRHFNSKTHLKRLTTSRKTTVPRGKKQKLGSSATDLSDEEKRYLWTLDDEIWKFLNELEIEKKNMNSESGIEILPTPPLSPNGSKSLIKTESDENKTNENWIQRSFL